MPVFKLSPPFGAFLAPVLPAIVPCHHIDPAIFKARLQSPETDSGGEVHTRHSERRRHQPRTLNVQIDNEGTGDDSANHSFHRYSMKPEPMPGKQPEHRRQKHDCQRKTRPAQPCRTTGTRAHPTPAQPSQPQRKKESSEPKKLQEKVAQVGPE